MQPIPQEDYGIYRRWFERSLDLIWRLPAELRAKADPMEELAKAERVSEGKAAKSLSAGIKDTISMTDRHSKSEIQVIDDLFVQDGLPTLTSMRSLFSREIRKILQSSRVANEEEYYTLKALEDCDLPDDTKSKVHELLGKYEISLDSSSMK